MTICGIKEICIFWVYRRDWCCGPFCLYHLLQNRSKQPQIQQDFVVTFSFDFVHSNFLRAVRNSLPANSFNFIFTLMESDQIFDKGYQLKYLATFFFKKR